MLSVCMHTLVGGTSQRETCRVGLLAGFSNTPMRHEMSDILHACLSMNIFRITHKLTMDTARFVPECLCLASKSGSNKGQRRIAQLEGIRARQVYILVNIPESYQYECHDMLR